MIKRVFDFCGREINDDISHIGADYGKSTKYFQEEYNPSNIRVNR